MTPDFLDMLRALSAGQVRFLAVGAHAMALHGEPRAAGDLDIWIDRALENATRVHSALRAFGVPVDELSVEDLTDPEVIYQIGVAPKRIDILPAISGVGFGMAWENRVMVTIDGLEVPVLGRSDLILNKRAVGRLKDLADIEALGGG